MNLEQLQYPIGRCEYPIMYTKEILEVLLLDLETFPKRLELAVQNLNETQLNTCYREGGWTLNQVIHHCADSHMNAIVRIKMALTEDNPSIKPYDEALWALCADYILPFNNSFTLLFCVHNKLNILLRNLSEAQLNRTYYHTQYERAFSIKDVICLYAWHGNHHLAHIESLKERMSW